MAEAPDQPGRNTARVSGLLVLGNHTHGDKISAHEGGRFSLRLVKGASSVVR